MAAQWPTEIISHDDGTSACGRRALAPNRSSATITSTSADPHDMASPTSRRPVTTAFAGVPVDIVSNNKECESAVVAVTLWPRSL
jgi:hypothetical protein